MTEAEKAAAAKAELEKKAAAEKAEAEKKAAEAGAEDEPDDEPDVGEGTISKKDFEAFKQKSNKENEKHRKAAKEANDKLAATLDGFKRALGIGPADPAADPGAALKTSEAKQRELILRAAFAERAKDAGAVNVGDAFQLAKKYLGEVKVSLTEDVADEEEIDEAIQKLKEAKPYLFAAAGSGGEGGEGDGPKAPAKMPDGGGNPAKGGGTAFQNWQTLVKAGRMNEANAYYGKNKPAIKASWK